MWSPFSHISFGQEMHDRHEESSIVLRSGDPLVVSIMCKSLKTCSRMPVATEKSSICPACGWSISERLGRRLIDIIGRDYASSSNAEILHRASVYPQIPLLTPKGDKIPIASLPIQSIPQHHQARMRPVVGALNAWSW